MTITAFQSLACPLDGEPMRREAGRWQCPTGHSFDIARQGYTHLLPVQHKRSRDPGDSKEMVAARRRFLNAGHYQPVADAISARLLDAPPAPEATHCLDAGCGEGYYLRQLAQSAGSGHPLALMGLDISKWAVLAAAKQDKRPTWVVGSNAHLPVLSHSLDWILCIFGFPAYAEFARTLRSGGQVLKVDPGPEHLRELREIIYPRLKTPQAQSQAPAGFRVSHTDAVNYQLTLRSAGQIADLLAMTPHLYRASAEGRAKASQLTSLCVTIDVRLSRLVPTGC